MPAPNVVRQAEDFMSGKVDVMFFALGSAAIKQANASVGGVRVLEVDTAPEAIKRAQALIPGAYVMQVAPHPSVEGVSKPTNLIAFDMVLMTNAKVKDDVVYRTVKALHENKPELVATFPPGTALTRRWSVVGQVGEGEGVWVDSRRSERLSGWNHF